MNYKLLSILFLVLFISPTFAQNWNISLDGGLTYNQFFERRNYTVVNNNLIDSIGEASNPIFTPMNFDLYNISLTCDNFVIVDALTGTPLLFELKKCNSLGTPLQLFEMELIVNMPNILVGQAYNFYLYYNNQSLFSNLAYQVPNANPRNDLLFNYLSAIEYNTTNNITQPIFNATDLTFNFLKRANIGNSTGGLYIYEDAEPYINDYAHVFICTSVVENRIYDKFNFFGEIMSELEQLDTNKGDKCINAPYNAGTARFTFPMDMINTPVDIYFIMGTFDVNTFGIPQIQDKKLYKKLGETTLSQGYQYTIVIEPEDLHPRWKVWLNTGYQYFTIIISIAGILLGIYLTGSVLTGSAIGLGIGILFKLLGSTII